MESSRKRKFQGLLQVWKAGRLASQGLETTGKARLVKVNWAGTERNLRRKSAMKARQHKTGVPLKAGVVLKM